MSVVSVFSKSGGSLYLAALLTLIGGLVSRSGVARSEHGIEGFGEARAYSFRDEAPVNDIRIPDRLLSQLKSLTDSLKSKTHPEQKTIGYQRKAGYQLLRAQADSIRSLVTACASTQTRLTIQELGTIYELVRDIEQLEIRLDDMGWITTGFHGFLTLAVNVVSDIALVNHGRTNEPPVMTNLVQAFLNDARYLGVRMDYLLTRLGRRCFATH